MGTNMVEFEDENLKLDEAFNSEALQEISQLQEDILLTLRNELRKLKEPEVIGASNVSSPRFEIGQDMTPLPSHHGSISLLQPVRLFSPIGGGSKRRTPKSCKILSVKRSNTSSTVSRRYDYRTRNYPRPWAETPRRRRTLSGESLEVHVTTSHFSDLSTLSMDRGEDNEQQNDLLSVAIMEGTTANPSESCETWRKSVKLKNVVKEHKRRPNDRSKSRISLASLSSRLKQRGRTGVQVNYVFQENRSQHYTVVKPVLFPAPVEGKKPKSSTSRKKSSKKLFSQDVNNNQIEPKKAIAKMPVKSATNSPKKIEHSFPNPIVAHRSELVHQKRTDSKSIQVTLAQDQEAQTEHVLSTISSEFELGLLIATVLDEMVDSAMENEKTGDRIIQGVRQSLKETQEIFTKTRPPRTRSDISNMKDANNNELNKPSFTCCLTTMTQDKSRSSLHRLTKKSSQSLKTNLAKSCSPKLQVQQDGHPMNSHPNYIDPLKQIKSQQINIFCTNSSDSSKCPTSAMKNFGTSPMKRRFARVSASRRHTYDWHCDPEDNTGNEGIIQDHHYYNPSLFQQPQRQPSSNSVPVEITSDQHQQRHHPTLKHFRRRKLITPWKKRLWLRHRHHIDTSEESDSSFIPDDDTSTDSNYFHTDWLLTDDDSSSHNDTEKQQQHQQISRRQRSSSRKRNIKMSSYQAPEFSDLFPHADSILAEAHHILSKHSYHYEAASSSKSTN